MAYATIGEFTAYTNSEIPGDATFLQLALDAAEAAVNDHCGRTFDAPAGGASTRSYVPERDGVTVITHDFVDATGLTVTNNGATVDATQFQLEPLNGLTSQNAATPFHRLRMLRNFWYRWDDEATVAVTTDRWGWAAVPVEVKQATLVLAKDLIHIRQVRFGVAGFGDFGPVRVRDNPTVALMLRDLRHPAKIGVG